MMADNRTGLSAADLAAQFRDVCGDGSMEWVYTPMQTWLLLDAADMLDENARLRSCLTDAAENARLILGENAQLREQGARLFDKTLELGTENAKLRKLINVMAYCMQGFRDCDGCAVNGAAGVVTAPSGCDWLRDRMRELGVVE